ncbi:MAG: hypothetical protein LBS59_06290 [Puniceicoccales bacterium]|jgi:hypothetical protein|nr:hypothetical protein [Puniceicoccales bacterium]
MKKEIKRDKQIKIAGKLVFAGQVYRWRYDNEKDNPFSSELNEKRWRAFLSVKQGWEALNASLFLPLLDENFEYGSYWVTQPDLDAVAYRNYITGKFDTIARTKSAPTLSIVILREGISPAGYTYALLLRQGENSGLLVFDFSAEKISRLYMTDPDIYAFETWQTGILDANGEPRMFNHEAAAECLGMKMSKEKLVAFGTEIAATLLHEKGMKIVSTYPKPDSEYPNVVYEAGGSCYYMRILTFTPPDRDAIVSKAEMADFIRLAHQRNALAVIQPVGFYCMDTFGGAALNGASFAIKLNEPTCY